jgi:hypothetical protein
MSNIESTLGRIEEKVDHIKETTDRQEGCLRDHSERIRTLEVFKGKMKGIWIAIAGVLAIIGALAAL